MTKVRINPGVCGLVTTVEVSGDNGRKLTIKAESQCENVRKMVNVLGDTFDGYRLCSNKPGSGPLYEFASQNFPAHSGCISISGVLKAVEAECKMALPRDASITFE